MQTALSKPRIAAIDILRGFVMLIMALDHVRDFFHDTAMQQDPLDLQTTYPILFFTRWITHFCAPIFVFLSGTSAYLSGQRKSKKKLSIFLMKRGLWLVIAEITIVTLGLTFNPFYNVIILQVIWAIGCSMILLGLLVPLPLPVIATIGFLLVFGHNITDHLTLPKEGPANILITVLVSSLGNFIPTGANRGILVLYAILPWTGLMLSGYCLGYFYQPRFSEQKRNRILIAIGISVISLFIVLRYSNVYGDPRKWTPQRSNLYTILSFINTSKYPPSLLYSCMTIGPALLLLVFFEKLKGRFTTIVSTYGRVPFFYYLLHFYAIHSLCVILFFVSGYNTGQIIDERTPFLFRPLAFGYSLPVVYAIWLGLIAVLYFPCRWYDRYKLTHHQWWLSYL